MELLPDPLGPTRAWKGDSVAAPELFALRREDLIQPLQRQHKDH